MPNLSGGGKGADRDSGPGGTQKKHGLILPGSAMGMRLNYTNIDTL